MVKPGPMEGMKKARPDQSNPWSEMGGLPKGLNPVYTVKRAGEEVSTTTRHEAVPLSRRPPGHMIMPNRLSDSNVKREKPPQTGLKTRTARETEGRTGRDKLPRERQARATLAGGTPSWPRGRQSQRDPGSRTTSHSGRRQPSGKLTQKRKPTGLHSQGGTWTSSTT